jgi:hypothetical protein
MKKQFILLLIIVMSTTYISNIFAQQLPNPGTDEWKILPIELRREACNIPEAELASLSTDELLQRCLNY